MKIVNLATLLQQPEGTPFHKYEPCCFGELEFFGGPCGPDFLTASSTWVESDSSDRMFEILEQAENEGTAFNFDYNSHGRDGLFEPDQLFAIYERADVERLIEKLQQALNPKQEDKKP